MHGYRPRTGGLEAHLAAALLLTDLAEARIPIIFAAEPAEAALLSSSAWRKNENPKIFANK
jgi:hypothetical protein